MKVKLPKHTFNTALCISLLAVTGCSSKELSEKEQAIKEARKRDNERRVVLIEAVHEILDAPAPTQAELDELVSSAVNNMVRIEGGEFLMGVNPERLGGSWEGWKPVEGKRQGASISQSALHEHPVKLDSYYLSKYETTYAEFDAWKKATGREIRFVGHDTFRYRYSASNSYKGLNTRMLECCRAPQKPAAADWYEAKEYCEWLGEQSGLPITLPTEAQWEYAARERGRWLMYSTKWGGISRETSGDGNMTNSVNSLSHSYNDLGIYFMNGNLSEWVLDWYDPDYYNHSPFDNPMNDEALKLSVGTVKNEVAKVFRGGHAFLDNSMGKEVNVYERFYHQPDRYEFATVGIRCAVNTKKKALN